MTEPVLQQLPRPRYERADRDWYVEPRWAVAALLAAESIEGAVWDPACGMGTIPAVCREAGLATRATDIVDRGYAHFDGQLDFIAADASFQPIPNIVCNPPYSYKRGIAEAFVRRALAHATECVAMLLPIAWMASQGRYALFRDHQPVRIHIFSQRPSMPPGHLIDLLGPKAFKDGTVDYAWFVWRPNVAVAQSEIRWLPPMEDAA